VLSWVEPDQVTIPAGIVIPVLDREKIARYYEEIFQFELATYSFLSNGARDVVLKLRQIEN
jgi:hypothetical protein